MQHEKDVAYLVVRRTSWDDRLWSPPDLGTSGRVCRRGEPCAAAVQVAAGVGFTLFLVDAPQEEFTRFPTWKAETVDNLATLGGADDEEEKGGKRKGAPAKGASKKARK